MGGAKVATMTSADRALARVRLITSLLPVDAILYSEETAVWRIRQRRGHDVAELPFGVGFLADIRYSCLAVLHVKLALDNALIGRHMAYHTRRAT
jgi:hypothetical protein